MKHENKIDESKILDIETLQFDKKFQQNVKTIYKTFGQEFLIKFNDSLNIHATMNEFSTIANTKYYEILTDIFEIQFYSEHKINSNAYIGYITKSDELGISGTSSIKFVLDFLRKLKCKKAFLIDRASVKCKDSEMNLSLIKLLDGRATFYTRLGFKFNIKKDLKYKVPNKVLVNYINKKLEIVNNKTIKDLLKEYISIRRLLLSNNEYNFITDDRIESGELTGSKKAKYISSLLFEIGVVVPILKEYGTKFKYVKDLLVYLFNNKENCEKFLELDKAFFNSGIIALWSKNIIINRDFIVSYQELDNIIFKSDFEYKF